MVDRICLKVLGPGFCIGMTIDVEPGGTAGARIDTVGDLLRTLRTQQPEMAAVCRLHECDGQNGDLYYRNVRLTSPGARLVEDVGVPVETLTRGGMETLEYRIRGSGESTSSSGAYFFGTAHASASASTGPGDGDGSSNNNNRSLEEDFEAAIKTVLAQHDPTPVLSGLVKVLGNICQNPTNPRYQKIKRENPKFRQLVGDHPGGIQVLVACGFRDHVTLDDDGDGIEYLQYQPSDENLKKVTQATDTLRRMVQELDRAKSLVDTCQSGPLEVVPIAPAHQSLQIYRQILGPRHVLVAGGMGLVAGILHNQGQDAQALTLCREAKDMMEDLAGPNHPDLAPILANLAYMLRNDAEARGEMERLISRALELQQSRHMLRVLNISAGVQMTLGRYDMAIAQWQQVLDNISESDLGYFVILGNLARARAESNDDVGAERDYQAAVQLGERQFGREHLQLAGLLANLATVQDKLGRADEAESNLERALNIRDRSLSFGNPLTQQVFRALCVFLEDKKKYQKLSNNLRRCCDFTQRALGPRHPGTAKSITNAALVLHRYENNPREAIPLLRRAVGIYEVALGLENSDTLMAQIHLGSALGNINASEAESILVEALSTAEFRADQKCLGPALSTLGALDVDKGDYEIAFIRLERGLQLNIQEHGDDVWYTEMNRRDLGRAFRATGRPERAKSLYELCAKYFERKLLATDERLIGLRQDIEDLNN